MLKNKIKSIIGAVIVWLFLTLYPWQAWVEGVSVFRFVIGLVIFIIPGSLTFLFVTDNKNIAPRILLGGFVVSIFAMGLLGLLARLLQSSFILIRWGFVLWGVGIVVALSVQKEKITWKFEKFTWLDIVLLLISFGGAGYFVSIANPPLIHDDAFSYNALLYYYQHATALDFVFPTALKRMEIPRFWIAYWPLVEAMISDLSHVDGLIVAGAYLSSALACFSFLSIYSLARTLGFSRVLAGAAILAQGFCLMRLTNFNQPGNIFFQRLTEDKVVAAFVISLVLILIVVEYLERPTARKLILVSMVALAMVFTHPVQFGMTCMIIGVYGLPSLIDKKLRGSYFSLIGVLAIIVLIPYFFRFGDGEYSKTLSFSIADVAKNDDFARLGNRIDIVEGTGYYGISRSITPGLPYEIGFASTIVSLFFFWRYKFARYILSAFLVLGVSMFPYTGWIVGMFTTPFQLWRLTWLMPFGLAFAFLIWVGFEAVQKIKLFERWSQWVRPLFHISVYIVLIVGMVLVRPWALGHVETKNLDEVEIYNNYINAAALMNDLDVSSPIIVGGPDAVTNSIIPSLTMKYEPLFFRIEIDSRRRQLWKSMVGNEDILIEDRLSLFRENKVEYLLLKGKPGWVMEFSNKYPERISLVFRNERFSLYKIIP